ncbi:MAG: phosphoribosyltransferase domain-containing protein [Candidatus Sericytochromatia bacterium]|nr:phosphoribosyltransferase domain-containing protein [Candidatus Sericytochromatia bacterium]
MKIELKTGTLSVNETEELNNLTGFGSRENKKRGYLFVSKVLGKHIPSKPSEMDIIHQKLANELNTKLNDDYTIYIGFAETATGLGNGVYEYAKNNKSFYIHTTRYNLSYPRLIEFEEDHSHAPSHILYHIKNPAIEDILIHVKNIVLIDDEISTGKTISNIIEQLKISFPLVKNYYCVSILNWMKETPDNVEFISLYKDTFTFEDKDFEITETSKSITENNDYLNSFMPNNFGRFGIRNSAIDYSEFMDLSKLQGKKILVIGTGEFIYQPFLFAKHLESQGIETYLQSTTRSPVNVEFDIHSKISFKDNYGENIDNFLYNVIDKTYDQIFICYETISKINNHELKNKLLEYFSKVDEIHFEAFI